MTTVSIGEGVNCWFGKLGDYISAHPDGDVTWPVITDPLNGGAYKEITRISLTEGIWRIRGRTAITVEFGDSYDENPRVDLYECGLAMGFILIMGDFDCMDTTPKPLSPYCIHTYQAEKLLTIPAEGADVVLFGYVNYGNKSNSAKCQWRASATVIEATRNG